FYPWLRLLLQLLFISMHIGFFFCLRIGLFPFVSITSLLSFTPGWVWDKLGERLRTPERLGLKIYYDKDCGFCLKTCRLLRTFLLFPEIPIRPAQDFAKIYPTMQAHNSWVVVDHEGSQHIKWAALVMLFKRSPIFWPLAALFGASFLRSAGDRFYQWVAANRGRLGDFTAVWLPYRSYPLHLALPAQIVVVGFALTVLWSNFSGVPGFSYRLPGQLREVRDTLALNQKWNMFAPTPSVVDGWYVVRGETRAGTAVDVLRNRVGEPNFTRPKDLASEYPNYRWRKYLTRLAFAPNKALRASFARYLCRSWDQGKPESDRLASVKIYFNMERIELNDNPRPVNRVLLHEQLCGAPTPLRSDHLPSLQGQEEDPL
ncbi:MAG: DCC1-like thiol-disulfide oxidoreductase family protein, partial [Burkholderiales bacterium]